MQVDESWGLRVQLCLFEPLRGLEPNLDLTLPVTKCDAAALGAKHCLLEGFAWRVHYPLKHCQPVRLEQTFCLSGFHFGWHLCQLLTT